jgi:serine phosphatase RsbU (regulator of sigma subunit)
MFDDLGPLEPAYRSVDWAATPLGPVSTWSDTLVSTVSIMLHTHFPVTLLWGPELVLVYNAAYVQLIGDKHPNALGRPAREVFPEAWDTIGPLLEKALAGQASWVEDAYIPLHRRGFLEECYFTFSYSPVSNRERGVEGVIDIATETTPHLVSARRLQLLSALNERLLDAASPDDVRREAVALLRASTEDLAAVDIWLDGGTGGLDPSLPEAPVHASWDGSTEALETGDGRTVVWLPMSPARAAHLTGKSALVAALSPMLPADEDYLTFLRLVAATLTQTLDRVHAANAERQAANIQRGISEAFQRSLLPDPIRRARPEVAVRYQAAVELGQIGGDWYDWFELPDGSLTVVIGDVSGHDQRAAAAMSQVRNMLRGVAGILHPAMPSEVRRGLDVAMQGTTDTIFATAVLAQVSGQDRDELTLTWTNAGHPPPVIIHPDGTAELLETRPNLLLGLDAAAEAHDHRVDLPAGSTVVLYTDGLVERRGVPLSTSFAWLVEKLQGRHDMDVESLCDYLLQDVEAPEDDIALLVLRS